MRHRQFFSFLLLVFAYVFSGAHAGSNNIASTKVAASAIQESNPPSVVFSDVTGLENAKSRCYTPNGTLIGFFQIGDGPCSVPGGRVSIRPQKMVFKVKPGKIITVKHAAKLVSQSSGRISEWYQEQTLVQGRRGEVIDDSFDLGIFDSHTRIIFRAGYSKDFQLELINSLVIFQDQPDESDSVITYILTIQVKDGTTGTGCKCNFKSLDFLGRQFYA